MLISEQVAHVHNGNPLAGGGDQNVPDRSANDAPESGIPPRYQDGMGGIDLEKVKRDQRQARRAVVRAMIQSLRRLRPRARATFR